MIWKGGGRTAGLYAEDVARKRSRSSPSLSSSASVRVASSSAEGRYELAMYESSATTLIVGCDRECVSTWDTRTHLDTRQTNRAGEMVSSTARAIGDGSACGSSGLSTRTTRSGPMVDSSPTCGHNEMR